MRILNHTVNFFSIYSFQIVFCSKIASLLFSFKSHIMRTWTMLKMISKFSEERVTLKTKKKVTASFCLFMSIILQRRRQEIFIHCLFCKNYLAKRLLSWSQQKFSSLTCSLDNIFTCFSLKNEKIHFEDEALVRTAKIG